MASDFSYSRNLKLKIGNYLTPDAKYNLEVIDQSFGTFTTTDAGTVVFTSTSGFTFRTGGGLGGGTAAFGVPGQIPTNVRVYGDIRGNSLTLNDTGSLFTSKLLAPTLAADQTITLPVIGSPGQVIAWGIGGRLISIDVGAGGTLVIPITYATSIVPVAVGDSLDVAIGKAEGQAQAAKTAADLALSEIASIVIPPAAPGHASTFNSTTDWTAGTGVYTRTIPVATHAQGLKPLTTVYEGTLTYQEVICDVLLSATGDVTISVASIPDKRFAGLLTIKAL